MMNTEDKEKGSLTVFETDKGLSPKIGKIAAQMIDLLAGAGIPTHKQGAFVSKTLKTSISTARRLLRGDVEWSENELDVVLGSIDLTWNGLTVSSTKTKLATEVDVLLETIEPIKHTCKLVVDGIEMMCDVIEDASTTPPPLASDDLCLRLNSQGEAEIVRSFTSPNKAQLRRISSIQIRPIYERTGPRLAIFDDEPSMVEMLSRTLSKAGFNTEHFTRAEDLLERCSRKPPFDAFLLDWLLQDNKDISNYIQALRVMAPKAPMTIMSGHFGAEEADREILSTAEEYNLTFLSKPVATIELIRHITMAIQKSSSENIGDERDQIEDSSQVGNL